MIPYGRQNINDEDIAAVISVLQSDWLTQGHKVPEFENLISLYTSASNAVAFNSATSALHTACLSLDLGPRDILWTVPNTFVASANCGRLCGANIDFVDIDAKTYCMDPNALEEKLNKAKKSGQLPKVIVPVHFAGQSADMRAITELTKPYGIKIIEDASHAIGGRYLNSPIGSCEFSDAAVFSFHPVKIITTAEGGIVTTNDTSLTERMKMIRNHGITRNPEKFDCNHSDPWLYQQIDLGLNYRMTDIQAALGISQINRLDEFVIRRRILAKQYDEQLSGLPVIYPWQDTNGMSARHLYPILIDTRESETDRRSVFKQLQGNGIGVGVHYIPVHLQPYYRKFGFNLGDFPNAEWYYSKEISLPLYYDLSNEQQEFVVECLRKSLK